MALVLGFNIGERFWVDETEVLVKNIPGDNHIVLTCEDTDYDVIGTEKTEIMPNVFVYCGYGKNPATGEKSFRHTVKIAGENVEFYKLAIEAPRSMEILREQKHATVSKRSDYE